MCKKLHGEAESIDQFGMDEWQKYSPPTLLKQFKAEDIFTMDETGLFYRCLPDRSHVFKTDKCKSGKLSKTNRFSDSKHGCTKVATSCYWQVSKSKMFQKHYETAIAI